ncbi:MAG TPA: hypothetical protein VHF06_05330 [Pseudonocardiaceae bacterium]|nr:hypothetical protein [Pseudonocardiaceae bacterium]
MKIGHKDVEHRDIESAETEPVGRPDRPVGQERVALTEPREPETLDGESGAHPAADEPMPDEPMTEPVAADRPMDKPVAAGTQTGEPVATDRPMDEPVAAGTPTGEPVPAGQSVESKAPVAQENSGLFSDREADGYLRDWRSLQAAFVDDPQAAVGQAEALVGRIVDQAGARISERRAALSAMRTDTTGERTEQLRQTLRGYRALVEQLLPR